LSFLLLQNFIATDSIGSHIRILNRDEARLQIERPLRKVPGKSR
jgi:hypothetical protein